LIDEQIWSAKTLDRSPVGSAGRLHFNSASCGIDVRAAEPTRD